ncbi:ERMES complex subunit MMM1 KNAG_0H02500 [Huiozyma naganishii CBS 8797]|uniref:Maintenance of mitochondrial morphology protein 1 n=1 Tax=Huiozyma naganishii (strain ATCC MYA-139 / BCRC 22969 / CBS 8797 / KCTC 17520 / NBRC 10181 / NCYC 3082 / Yp74L-3) TaxID=1071383 RepID=J7R9W2_HUIN7|nr:hypothetical protein KNAG_0H02500 [Kazachstania naganishii CBS 8797]CCK71665.1 hypothetical protein KNAG_0H02500 [Kazachstania naganishii CBS 8797]
MSNLFEGSERAIGADQSLSSNITLDDYIRNILPAQLNETLLQNLQEQNKNVSKDIIDELARSWELLTEKGADMARQLAPRTLNPPVQQSSFSAWSFSQGLVLGQLSIVLLMFFFIKFFIFSDGKNDDRNPPVTSSASSSSEYVNKTRTKLETTLESSDIDDPTVLKRGGQEAKSNYNNSMNDSDLERVSLTDKILDKTYYNVATHQSESLDWFNVLIAQIIEQFREEATNKDNIIKFLNRFVGDNSINLPDYLGDIRVTEIDIGDDFPIFSNCRIEKEKQKLEAKIDIDLNDRLALGVETKLLLNYPKRNFAALPINLTVAVVRFQGCLTVSLTKASDFIPPKNDTTSNSSETFHTEEDNGYFLVFSFSPEYKMDFEISSLIGARSKLENIPKITDVLEYQIKKWFVERCVEPRFQFIKLPSIWPRSKNVRQE